MSQQKRAYWLVAEILFAMLLVIVLSKSTASGKENKSNTNFKITLPCQVPWRDPNHDQIFDALCRNAIQLGLGVELVDDGDLRHLKKAYGIKGHLILPEYYSPLGPGLNNPRYGAAAVKITEWAIDMVGSYGGGEVMAFVGYDHMDVGKASSEPISLEEGAVNCIANLKKLAKFCNDPDHPERKDVVVCLAMLNDRNFGDVPNTITNNYLNMKGYPGYQGNHLQWVANIVRAVDSPNIKLMFSCYDVFIMDCRTTKDLTTLMLKNKDIIGYISVAQHECRSEINYFGGKAMINYIEVARAIRDMDYTGCVGLDYIPTKDPSGKPLTTETNPRFDETGNLLQAIAILRGETTKTRSG